MKFTYRLAYYLFGFMIGGLFLFFIFDNKRTEFCYLPNCRVLKNIRSKGMVISPEAQKQLDAKWFTDKDLRFALENGSVDFSKSNKPVKGGGKLYVIESKTAKDEPVIVEMVNYENKSVFKDVKKE